VTKPLIVLLIALSIAASAARSTSVVVTGTARDCFQQSKLYVQDLEVAAFNPATNRPLDSLVKLMASINYGEANDATQARFDSSYFKILAIVKDSLALARDTTDVAGRFTLSFAAVDSVIVIGQREREDEPYFIQNKRISGLTNSTILLDMSGGQCAY
jgi:hypothetical protein